MSITGPCVQVSDRACTNCGSKKPSDDFYRKGPRLESICKECKRTKRRFDYRFQMSKGDSARLQKLTHIVLDHYIKEYAAMNDEIEKTIRTVETRDMGVAA